MVSCTVTVSLKTLGALLDRFTAEIAVPEWWNVKKWAVINLIEVNMSSDCLKNKQ